MSQKFLGEWGYNLVRFGYLSLWGDIIELHYLRYKRITFTISKSLPLSFKMRYAMHIHYASSSTEFRLNTEYYYSWQPCSYHCVPSDVLESCWKDFDARNYAFSIMTSVWSLVFYCATTVFARAFPTLLLLSLD